MGLTPSDRNSGLFSLVGDIFGTVLGRVIVGAFTVIGSIALGTNLGAPDRFTGTMGKELEARIERCEHYRERDEVTMKAITDYVQTHEISADAYKGMIVELKAGLGECRRNYDRLQRRLESYERNK
jgi:hypothetical protein